ncbi:MAG: NAD-dependent epimerase/dehydratase family protein, partial [Phycisphaerales bacterium]|nr:NAD-dependent epimerase/dehydratase family protein [Phycisphaerales bacterium]
MTRTACITGGAGFIGSHLVEHLVGAGDRVVVLDDFSTGLHDNLDPAARLVEGSVQDEGAIAEAVSGCDVVFHLASRVSVAESVEHPDLYHDVTALGTRRVLDAAAAAGVSKLVLASSCSVYGDAPVPVSEGAPISPLSPYAQAKADAEGFCWEAASDTLATISMRFFNVYGPRQRADSPYSGVIAKFMDARSRGEPPTVFGDGGQTRDFIFVADVVDALVLAAASTAPGDGARLNVGTGKAVSVLDLLEAVGCASPNFKPAREGEIRHSRADPDHAA